MQGKEEELKSWLSFTQLSSHHSQLTKLFFAKEEEKVDF